MKVLNLYAGIGGNRSAMGRILKMSQSKVYFNMTLMGLKSPFSKNGKMPEVSEEFWSEEMHEKCFNF